VREAVFNSLGSIDALDGARVLDLYAGSGALGIEALSRGASRAVFVDTDRAARRAVEQNLAATGLAERAEVVALDGIRYLGRVVETGAERFDLVLLDPPYATPDEVWRDLFDLLGTAAPNAVVVTESDRDLALPEGWDALRTKRYGGTVVTVLMPPNPLSEPS
jgi:16S rRNA (guanine966-N2)-methyltransferase